MTSSHHRIFINIVSALFIFLFTYTAINKFIKMDVFRHVLSKSYLIGNWSPFVSRAIVMSECIAVLLLIYSPLRLLGLYLSSVLMILFTGYIFIMLVSSSDLPCSCGGAFKQLSWAQHLWVNILLTLLAVTGSTLERKRSVSLNKRT